MKIGNLDKRVTILHRNTTTDAWNHSVASYVNLGDAWAEVQYKRGTEEQVGQQRVGVDHVHFIMRHRNDISTTSIIEYDGDKHNVHSVEIIGRKLGLRLITTKRDNGAE